MKEIKILYQADKILADENNKEITVEVLPELEESGLAQFALLDISDEEYEAIQKYWPENELMIFRLIVANKFKKYFTDKKISFLNPDNYYNLPTNDQGLAEIPENFDISQYSFVGIPKELTVTFNHDGDCILDYSTAPVYPEMIPISQDLRDLITSFEHGLHSIPHYKDFERYTEEDTAKSNYLYELGVKIAIELKKQLPDWKIRFHNMVGFYDLHQDYDNCSEITPGLEFEHIKTTM